MLNAQSPTNPLSNLRTKTIPLSQILFTDTLTLDTLSIVPNSVQVCWQISQKNSLLDTIIYQIDYPNALLIGTGRQAVQLTDFQENTDSLKLHITYRVFPYLFTETQSHKDRKEIIPIGEVPIAYFRHEVGKTKTVNDFFPSNGLNYTGSFGRGIAFGNKQDVVVNSNFNLQMAGKLPNGVNILAAISDNNIPFQPEGNTQQLQEFDRIFIQLTKDRTSLLLGDYELRQPESYFMRFFRKVQGAQVSQSWTISDSVEVNSSVSTAIARGNYNRMPINGEEGNQGPYQLRGTNGEAFIIVLSNTERVFVDGKQLKRGADLDYVIDYNTAEITFTPNQLITKDSRIVVEFEYSDRSYLRSLIHAQTNYESKKMKLRFNAFSEQDAKNQPLIDGEFGSVQFETLKSIGDRVEQALVPSGTMTAEFDPNRINYALQDTLVNGVLYDSIFVYTSNADAMVYQLTFSQVGRGQGNYILSDRTVNGRLFEWIAPEEETGKPRGNYAPVIKLIPPQKRQMMTLGADYVWNKNTTLNTEIALTRKDVNTFSDLEDADDGGLGISLGLNNQVFFGNRQSTKKTKPTSGTWRLQTNLLYEYRQATFEPLENYRPIEFNRNWNLADEEIADEHTGSVQVKLQQGRMFQVNYELRSLLRSDNLYQGFRHGVKSRFAKNNWLLTAEGTYLQAQENQQGESQFFRPSVLVQKRLPSWNNWAVGIKGVREKNEVLEGQNPFLSPRSFHFDQMEVFVQSPDTARKTLKMTYVQRLDYGLDSITAQNFELATIAHTLNFTGSFTENTQNTLRWNVNYRNLEVRDSSLVTQSSQVPRALQSLLGNVNHNWRVKKGLFRLSTQYQIGQGQEQRSEYFYQRVDAGKGTHIWIDDTTDLQGIDIEELDEFELANEVNGNVADYIRVILPTGEYQKTNVIQFNQSLNFDPRRAWKDGKAWQQAMSRFSVQLNFLVNRKTLADQSGFGALLPFFVALDSNSVVQENRNMRQSLFFNRNSPKFEWNVYHQNLANTYLLVGGTDQRGNETYGGNIKWNWNRKLSFRLNGNFGALSNLSQAFANRNYRIDYWEVQPALTFQPSTNSRFALTYEYAQKQNQITASGQATNEGEQTLNQKMIADARIGTINRGSITGRLTYANIVSANIIPNAPAAYTMLEGLQVGSNYLWTLSYDTRLPGNLQLTLSYDGRKIGDAKTTHTGRASVRALF